MRYVQPLKIDDLSKKPIADCYDFKVIKRYQEWPDETGYMEATKMWANPFYMYQMIKGEKGTFAEMCEKIVGWCVDFHQMLRHGYDDHISVMVAYEPNVFKELSYEEIYFVWLPGMQRLVRQAKGGGVRVVLASKGFLVDDLKRLATYFDDVWDMGKPPLLDMEAVVVGENGNRMGVRHYGK